MLSQTIPFSVVLSQYQCILKTQALQEGGGAIALEAGGTFCMALTAQGKVIVWGRIGGPGGPRGSQGGSRGIHPPMVAEVRGLPPIISLAAGQSHGLLTDGERVWAIGRLV